MAITYKGNCEFEITGPGLWKTDVLGLDHYSEEWRGRADKLADFLDSLRENAAHPEFPGVFFVGASNDKNPVFPTANLEYVGFRSGKPRAPLYTPSMAVQSAQASLNLPDAGKSSVETQFYAPSGQWEWFQYTDPGDTPDHFAVLSTRNPLDKKIRWSIKPEDPDATTVSIGDYTAAMNAFNVVEMIQNFEPSEVVPGKLWRCRCTSVRTVQA